MDAMDPKIIQVIGDCPWENQWCGNRGEKEKTHGEMTKN
jgi:hypothetical protein